MIKYILAAVVILSLLLIGTGLFLQRRNSASTQPIQTVTEQDDPISPAETMKLNLPTPLESNASDSAILVRINDLTKQVATLMGFNTKVDNLERQIDDLNDRLSKLEKNQSYSIASASPASSSQVVSSTRGPEYLYALGYGGNSTSTDWTEVSTLSIAYDPALYSGYKSLQLEVYMHVKDGNGKAFARLYSAGTAAVASEVSSGNYQDEWVSGGTFTWNSKASFTMQIKSLTGYDAYISNARLKINF